MYDNLQWQPMATIPEDGCWIIYCIEFPDKTRFISQTRALPFIHNGKPGRVIGWMDAEPLLTAPLGYDPTFGDDRLCLCGHAYYRHFDTYADMAPIGCKYCHASVEGVDYRKETRPPEEEDVQLRNEAELNHYYTKYASVCSGFQWDGVEVSNAEE